MTRIDNNAVGVIVSDLLLCSLDLHCSRDVCGALKQALVLSPLASLTLEGH